jgi:hypothetical protein
VSAVDRHVRVRDQVAVIRYDLQRALLRARRRGDRHGERDDRDRDEAESSWAAHAQ